MKTSAKYNQSIEFWKNKLLPDGQGGSYASYQLLFSDFALITDKEEKRVNQQGQLVLVGHTEITMRFRRDVNIEKGLIIKHDIDFYVIHSIINDRDREYQIMAVATDKILEIFENENPYTQPYTPPTNGGNTLPFILA